MATDSSRARSYTTWGIQKDSGIYEDRLVAFIDILGWSALIQASVKDKRVLKAVRIGANILGSHALGEAQTKAFLANWTLHHPAPRAARVELSLFSDTLVLSCRVATSACIDLISRVQFICRMLLEGGHYTRGAIVVGKLHHETHALFGPALIEAYKLEQNVAKYPRIIVTRAALSHCTEPERFTIKTDFDGLPYVDILGWGETGPDGQRVARWKEEKLLVQARARLKRDRADIGRVAKHQWIINYLEGVLGDCQVRDQAKGAHPERAPTLAVSPTDRSGSR